MPEKRTAEAGEGFAFLLVQLGFYAAARFGERLAPLGLEPRHVGMLRHLAANEAQSQQALGETLGLTPTRMVFLVDDLEHHGLVERRRNPTDRRSYSLYLTPQGHQSLEDATVAAAQHEASLGNSLTPNERTQLTRLLRRIATDQGISEHSLPGPPPGRRPASG